MQAVLGQVRAWSGLGAADSVGVCFRVYSKVKYEQEFPDETVPEILRTSLAQTVLTLKGLGVNDVFNFDYMDAPRPGAIASALKHLYFLGAVDADGRITDLGRDILIFPVEPAPARMLIASAEEGVVEDMLSVVAMMSTDSVFYRPTMVEERAVADSERILFMDSLGDAASMLAIWNGFQRASRPTEWCTKHFIQIRAMKKAADLRKQLAEVFDKSGIRVRPVVDDDAHRCRCDAVSTTASRLFTARSRPPST